MEQKNFTPTYHIATMFLTSFSEGYLSILAYSKILRLPLLPLLLKFSTQVVLVFLVIVDTYIDVEMLILNFWMLQLFVSLLGIDIAAVIGCEICCVEAHYVNGVGPNVVNVLKLSLLPLLLKRYFKVSLCVPVVGF